ncbi:hypothetical protein DAEQUDRAFT_762095 [Daedalea quercina L-15889]|uniref:Uncharacterized protein n=1 Tax=Daedalea quercina L-15889 TaxID=1314783 RepID=A0A165TMC3_9APHY|nr:hypothetical protein DAEQUDRAFT_762095 [Daedalea quercina L-15889]
MRQKSTILWSLNRGIPSLVITALVQSLLLDGPLKAASDDLGRAFGPLVPVSFLLVCGVFVYSAVYFGVFPLLSAYVFPPSIPAKESICKSRFQVLLHVMLAYIDEAIDTYMNRKSRSQLLAEILFLRDTLAEHRSVSRGRKKALSRLRRRHARVVAGYKNLKGDFEIEQTKYHDTLMSLSEAKEEITAWEFRVIILEHDVTASERALEIAKQDRSNLEEALRSEQHKRSEVDAVYQDEKAKQSELDERLHTEMHQSPELEQLIEGAYVEVARALGLRLDTSSLSSAEKLAKMVQQTQRLRTESHSLQGTLESALFDGSAKESMINELEEENRVLAATVEDKGKEIAALSEKNDRLLHETSGMGAEISQLNEDKDQLIRDVSDRDAEIARLHKKKANLVRAGLHKDAIIAQLDEEKAQRLPLALAKDAEIAILGEENKRLRCKASEQDKTTSELMNGLQQKVDAACSTLESKDLELHAKDKVIAVLQEEVRGLQGTAVEKDELIATLGNQNNALQNSVDAFNGSIDTMHFEALTKNVTIAKLEEQNSAKDVQIAVLEERVDAFRGSLEFVYLEQKAREGALVVGRV